MAYKSGDLSIKNVMDTRTDDYDSGDWVYLPHSCEKWVIGGTKEVESLIADLQKLLKRMDA